jgi:hypothetical protein
MRAGLCRRLARPLLGSGGGEGRAHERRKGLRASFSHDCSTMIVDRSLADAEIGRDVLAGMASENEVQDLTLTRCQCGYALRGGLRDSDSVAASCV